jgi:hypothetical protein
MKSKSKKTRTRIENPNKTNNDIFSMLSLFISPLASPASPVAGGQLTS